MVGGGGREDLRLHSDGCCHFSGTGRDVVDVMGAVEWSQVGSGLLRSGEVLLSPPIADSSPKAISPLSVHLVGSSVHASADTSQSGRWTELSLLTEVP